MHPKIILLFIFLFPTTNAFAQDKIYTRGKGVVNANIMEVTRARVIYRTFDDPGGKDKVLDWDDIHKVEYADGRIEYRLVPPKPKPTQVIDYGKNILCMALFNIGDEGIGYGFAYERLLDKDAMCSFYFPINIVFASPNNSSIYEDGLTRSRRIFQFMPGLKVYPTKNNGRVRCAFGPQLVYENGEKYDVREIKEAGITSYKLEYYHVEKIGILANSSFNLQPSKHIYMAADLGMGVSIMHKLNGVNSGAKQLIQFNIRMGYRF